MEKNEQLWVTISERLSVQPPRWGWEDVAFIRKSWRLGNQPPWLSNLLPKKRKKGALHIGMGRTERQQHLNNLLWFSPFPSGSQATPHLWACSSAQCLWWGDFSDFRSPTRLWNACQRGIWTSKGSKVVGKSNPQIVGGKNMSPLSYFYDFGSEDWGY